VVTIYDLQLADRIRLKDGREVDVLWTDVAAAIAHVVQEDGTEEDITGEVLEDATKVP
jgi:hypothetical protein